MIVSFEDKLRIEGTELEVLTETTNILTCIYEKLSEQEGGMYARGKLLQCLMSALGINPDDQPAS